MDKVKIPCTNCKVVSEVSSDAKDWKCANCNKKMWFRPCNNCKSTLQVPAGVGRGTFYICPFCSQKTLIPLLGSSPISNAYHLHYTLKSRGLNPDDIDFNRLISGCFVIGGYGHNITAGLPIVLVINKEEIQFQASNGIVYKNVKINDVIAVDVGGPGAITTGGGFVGGGTGIGGALRGMIFASVLNNLTTKTQIQTVIQISMINSEIVIFNEIFTPEALKTAISPLLNSVRMKKPLQDLAKERADISSQLLSLVQLYKSGLLTDKEFAAAKAKLID